MIAATNKDLQKEIRDGNFREDLYHRLGVILIKTPSLDQRKEDIPKLVSYFSKKICGEHGIIEKQFSAGAMNALKKYSWSGNIRELRNVIERLIILCADHIGQEDVKLHAGK